LFNPKLSSKPQVVVVNKIDVPEVRDLLPDLIEELKKKAGHNRVMGISAVTGERVNELMGRLRRMVDSLPEIDQSTEEDEERVDLSRDDSDEYEILHDPIRYPGQFRVVGEKIEKVLIFNSRISIVFL
jgi:GTP-binding protein